MLAASVSITLLAVCFACIFSCDCRCMLVCLLCVTPVKLPYLRIRCDVSLSTEQQMVGSLKGVTQSRQISMLL